MSIESSGVPKVRGGLRRNVVGTLFRQVLTAVVQLATVALVARILGPGANGEYALVVLLPTFLGTMLNLGVAPAAVFFIGRESASAGSLFSAAFWLWCGLAAVGTAMGGLAVAFFGENIFPGVSASVLWLGLTAFPAVLLNTFISGILQGKEDFRAYNSVLFAQPLFTLLLSAATLLWLNLGLFGAVGSFVVSQILTLLISLTLVRRHLVGPQHGVPAVRTCALQVIGYGWKAHLANILAFLTYRADIFLLNLLGGTASAGIYVIAVQIAERLSLFSQAVSTVILPRLVLLEREPDQRRRLTALAFRMTQIATFVGAIGLGIVVWLAIPVVFGHSYEDALVPFLLLLPGMVVIAGSRILANAIAATGRPELNMYVGVVVVLVNVGGDLLLIPGMGAVGAAIASTIAYVLNAVLRLAIVRYLEPDIRLREYIPRLSEVKDWLRTYRMGGSRAG